MKNKKASMEELIRIIIWLVFFILVGAGLYFLIKYLTEW